MLLHSGRRTGPQHELDSKEKKKEKEFKNECVKRKLQRNILYSTILELLLYVEYLLNYCYFKNNSVNIERRKVISKGSHTKSEDQLWG